MDDFKLVEEIPQDYTNHIPMVLQHWEPAFRKVFKTLTTESKLLGQTSAAGFRHPAERAFYAFEQYQIVIEYDGYGSPLRMFFPNENTELLMLMKA